MHLRYLLKFKIEFFYLSKSEQMVNSVCLICKKEVTGKEPLGIMYTPINKVAHYKCVVAYGYSKFINETAKRNK